MTIIIAIFSLFLLLIGFIAVDVILTSKRQKSRAATPISETIPDDNEIRNILTKVSKERGEADEIDFTVRGFDIDEVLQANAEWALYKTVRVKPEKDK